MIQVNVDVIRSLKTLKGKIEKADFDRLLSTFGLTEEDFEARISGLGKEYEFLCNLYLCNLADHIIPIDEKFTTVVGEKCYDAIVELKSGKKVMIEVKSTKEHKYSVSSGNFDKRVKWAKDQGYELYFAINIFNYWTLFSADQMKKWNRKIDESKLGYSQFSIVLGVHYYLSNNIKMIATYTDLMDLLNLNIYDTDRSHVSIKEQFYVDGNLVDEVTPTNANNLPFVLLSEALKTKSKMKKTKINEHDYTITYDLPGNNVFSVFEIFKESITHMEGIDDEDKYDTFMEIICKNPRRREQIKTYLDALAKVLRMIPMTLIPTPEK